jgi:hypothetical protein
MVEMVGIADIIDESVFSTVPGEWIIRSLAPGRSATIEYTVENHELVENNPQIIAEDEDLLTINSLNIVSEIRKDPVTVWRDERSSLLSWIILVVLASELVCMIYYIQKKVSFENLQDALNKIAVEIGIRWMRITEKVRAIYEKLPKIPKRIITMFKRTMLLASFAVRHVFIFGRLSFIWLANTWPFLWKLHDKLRKMNLSEKILFIKMMSDFLKEKIEITFNKIRHFIKVKMKITPTRPREPRSDIHRPDQYKKPENLRTEPVENTPSESEIRMQEESIKRYKESQELIERIMKDLKK